MSKTLILASNNAKKLKELQALLQPLLKRPEARVLAVGSTFGSLAHPGFAAYSASKFALRGFIEALGREHADSALIAQWIAPRATDTAFNPPNVVALNKALKTHVDAVEDVAALWPDLVAEDNNSKWQKALLATGKAN